jgi:hypothetical protein
MKGEDIGARLAIAIFEQGVCARGASDPLRSLMSAVTVTNDITGLATGVRKRRASIPEESADVPLLFAGILAQRRRARCIDDTEHHIDNAAAGRTARGNFVTAVCTSDQWRCAGPVVRKKGTP